jgi:hypothetical protein
VVTADQESGRVPSSWLAITAMVLSDAGSDAGRAPPSKVSSSCRNASAVRADRSDGMVPRIGLLDKSSDRSAVSADSQSGNVS